MSSFSIVVPCFNERLAIAELVESINEIILASGGNVIVVDDDAPERRIS